MATKKGSTSRKSAPSKATKRSSPSKSKKTSGETTLRSGVDVSKNRSVNIREIENGFIVREEIQTGKGRNMNWQTKEYFSPSEPQINVPKKSNFSLKKK